MNYREWLEKPSNVEGDPGRDGKVDGIVDRVRGRAALSTYREVIGNLASRGM